VLWFFIGQARSLMVAGILGLVGAAGVIALAIGRLQDQWLALVAFFVAWQAWKGFRLGTKLQQLQPSLELMNQGLAAVRLGKHDEAVALFTKVIEGGGEPGVLAPALTNRGLAESRRGEWQRALEDYAEALRLQPQLASAHNNLAWLLAACPIDGLRNGEVALVHATWACESSGWSTPSFLGTLAAAHAEVGDFGQAVHWQQRALADRRYRRRAVAAL
jgi:tetratricopeptide (TPR) repeat protein